MKYIGYLLVVALVVMPQIAAAHVVVKPNQAGIGSFTTFTVGVPVEKEMATIGLRLVIPEDLHHVTPNVKPGWKIEIKKSGSGEAAVVTELVWTGGTIPSGQRDEFLFSAQVPTQVTTVQWKAYQTYADGSIVAWDQDPHIEQPKTADGHSDFSKAGPYSVTNVVDDLVAQTASNSAPQSQTSSSLSLTFSLVAFVFSLIALFRSRSVKSEVSQ